MNTLAFGCVGQMWTHSSQIVHVARALAENSWLIVSEEDKVMRSLSLQQREPNLPALSMLLLRWWIWKKWKFEEKSHENGGRKWERCFGSRGDDKRRGEEDGGTSGCASWPQTVPRDLNYGCPTVTVYERMNRTAPGEERANVEITKGS